MKTVLITGGSSGIGFELSKHFAQKGYIILWVSLLAKELEEAKAELQQAFPKITIRTLPLDLCGTDASQKTYDWVQSNQWKVDVLVNNAGFATYGYAHTIALEREMRMLQLNVLGVFQLTRLFLDNMIARNAGTIINISSNASFTPLPKLAAYAATKAFVAHYSKALTIELNDLKSSVRVMTVCPAAIQDTPFKKAAKMEKVKTFTGLVATTKKEVASDIWRGFMKGQDYVVTGAKMRWMVPIQRILPHFIIRFLMNRELSET